MTHVCVTPFRSRSIFVIGDYRIITVCLLSRDLLSQVLVQLVPPLQLRQWWWGSTTLPSPFYFWSHCQVGLGAKHVFFYLDSPRWTKDWGKGCRAASVGSLDSNWIPGMLGARWGDPFLRQCKRFRRWLSAEQGWSTGKWSQEGDFILNVILDNV